MDDKDKTNKITAAPYSSTSRQELQAITVLRTLIQSSKIFQHFSENDKTPNIDGFFDLTDDNHVPIGKIEVQIKKLPNEFEKDPKFPCPTSLIQYAKYSTLTPVLLICVDIHNLIAYWISMDDLFSEKYYEKIENGQTTITIHFPENNCIDGKTMGYFESWKEIFEKYQLKIKNFDNLAEEYALLQERSNPIVGISKPEIREIHKYLDRLNELLDFKFDIVKKIFFPSSWKVGFAYHMFEDKQVTYEHYPIPMDKNDVQIKEINEDLKKQLKKTRLELISHYMGNPIKTNPENQALEYIQQKVKQILENHLLDHKVDEVLAREFIFDFIDHFSIQMGLEDKDIYSIREIEDGFFKYLPLWITEVFDSDEMKSMYARRGFHDPSLYLSLTPPTKRIEIATKIKDKLGENLKIPQILVGSKDYEFGIFLEMLTYLKLVNIEELRRVYSKRDFTRYQTRQSWVWNAFSIDDVVRNLNIFFENYPRIYSAIINKNFPNLKEKLPLFFESTYIIFIYDVKDDYHGFEAPTYDMYCFVSDEKRDVEIRIISKEDFDRSQLMEEIKAKHQISIQGQTFRCIIEIGGILEFIYNDRPLFHFLYSDFQKSVQNYFDHYEESAKG